MVDTRTEQRSRVPAIVAAAFLALTIALVVVLFSVIRPDRNDNSSGSSGASNPSSSSTDVPSGGLATEQQRVVDAATIEVKNIFTYARKSYDADYQRAIDGATGGVKTDLESNKAKLLAQMQSGKFDLEGAITGAAFEEIQGNQAVVLISAQGYKLPDGAERTLASAARFEVTLTLVGNRWLASGLTSVGLI